MLSLSTLARHVHGTMKLCGTNDPAERTRIRETLAQERAEPAGNLVSLWIAERKQARADAKEERQYNLMLKQIDAVIARCEIEEEQKRVQRVAEQERLRVEAAQEQERLRVKAEQDRHAAWLASAEGQDHQRLQNEHRSMQRSVCGLNSWALQTAAQCEEVLNDPESDRDEVTRADKWLILSRDMVRYHREELPEVLSLEAVSDILWRHFKVMVEHTTSETAHDRHGQVRREARKQAAWDREQAARDQEQAVRRQERDDADQARYDRQEQQRQADERHEYICDLENRLHKQYRLLEFSHSMCSNTTYQRAEIDRLNAALARA